MDNLNLSIPSVQETALSPEEQIEWLYKYKESKLTAGSNIRITREGDTTVISAIGEGFSPLVTITPIEGGNRLTIVDGEGSHSCDIMDGVDGVDGVSPQIVISSITGGHSVKVIDADHPTGQTFNVLDGTDGQDGSSVIVKSIDAVEGGVNVTLEDENGDHVLFLANGPQGLTGPAATVAVGTTTTTEPGGNAEVTNVGTASNAVFNFKIPTGQTGADGQDGADGVSPEVSFASITGGNRMTVTDATHPLGQSIDIMDGQDGADGSDGTDGVSPEVTIGVISGGHSVTITDADHPQGQTFNVMDGENAAAATVTVGTTTTGEAGTNASVVNVGTSSDAILNFTIPRGADGADGSDGQDGADGTDGTSAYCSVTKSGDTATITCTDANGTTTAQISDGSQGAQGNPGPAGPGVPAGGTAGQVLQKVDGTDYNTEWATPSGGGSDKILTLGWSPYNGSTALSYVSETNSAFNKVKVKIGTEAIVNSSNRYEEQSTYEIDLRGTYMKFEGGTLPTGGKTMQIRMDGMFGATYADASGNVTPLSTLVATGVQLINKTGIVLYTTSQMVGDSKWVWGRYELGIVTSAENSSRKAVAIIMNFASATAAASGTSSYEMLYFV